MLTNLFCNKKFAEFYCEQNDHSFFNLDDIWEKMFVTGNKIEQEIKYYPHSLFAYFNIIYNFEFPTSFIVIVYNFGNIKVQIQLSAILLKFQSSQGERRYSTSFPKHVFAYISKARQPKTMKFSKIISLSLYLNIMLIFINIELTGPTLEHYPAFVSFFKSCQFDLHYLD